MNLHIMPDDKYVEDYVKVAEKVSKPGENIYLIRDKRPFKYLTNAFDWVEAVPGSTEFAKHTAQLKKGDRLVLHFISSEIWEWLAEFDTEAKVLWAYWGSDFYENTRIEYPNHDPLTQKYLDRLLPKKLSRFYLLSEYRKWRQKRVGEEGQNKRRQVVKKAMIKIDFICHFMEGDFDLIKKYFDTNAQFFYFHYGLPFTFEQIETIAAQGSIKVSPYPKNIWLGNCGYPANNHFDMFPLLDNIDKDTGICVPLSYGDAAYTEYLIKEGKKRFGDQFIPLTDYMPFETFVRILKGMDVALMGHNSPWAMGNIVILFAFGKRVYVKDYIPSYRWMKENGACIGNYFEFNLSECFEPLSDDCKARNKHVAELLSLQDAEKIITKMLQL